MVEGSGSAKIPHSDSSTPSQDKQQTWRRLRKNRRMRVLQVNLHHSRTASAALCVAIKTCDVALIQEPWTFKGVIRGLKEAGGELIYSRSTLTHRTGILIKKVFRTLQLTNHCSRDLTAVKIKTSSGRGPREIILGSAYLPYDDAEPPTFLGIGKAGDELQGYRNSPHDWL
jgi:hypothetical protein